ncbi:MAG: LysR family transcriptional regulator [Luteolibacter sp.]
MEIDLPSLLVFRHLAKCGSFTETGKQWNISQPTVSQMVNRLESSLGIILLDRSGNTTCLTADGLSLLDRIDGVCDAYLEMVDGIGVLSRRIDHQVTIALDRSYYSSVVFSAKDKLKAPACSNLLFTELTGNWVEALKSGRVDVVFTCRFLHTGLSAGIQEALIKREAGITVAWNPEFYHFDSGKFSLPDILGTSILIPDDIQIPYFRDAIHNWCEQAYGMQPANIVTFSGEAEAASAAAAGLGILLSPGDAIPRIGPDAKDLSHTKAFEFPIPHALTLGVYCRSDETDREVIEAAAQLGKLATKLLPDNS